MQEICQSGSEGGAKHTFVPTPILNGCRREALGVGRLSRRRYSCAGGRPWIRSTSGEARHCAREKIQELVRGSSSRIAQGKGEIIRNRNSHSGRVRSAA